MLSRNQLKFLRTLHTGKGRTATGLYLAEGTKIADEMLAAGASIETLYATERWLAARTQQTAGVATQVVTPQELERASLLTTPQEVLVVARQQRPTLDVAALAGRLVLVLDQIRDPGNLGTIIRLADWFGIDTLLCAPDSVDRYNPKVVQATMGSFLRVTVHVEPLVPILGEAKQRGWPIYAAVLDGVSPATVTLSPHGLLLLGNESSGLSPELLPWVTTRLTIPRQHAGAESLNVATAAAILCWEFRRNSTV